MSKNNIWLDLIILMGSITMIEYFVKIGYFIEKHKMCNYVVGNV